MFAVDTGMFCDWGKCEAQEEHLILNCALLEGFEEL